MAWSSDSGEIGTRRLRRWIEPVLGSSLLVASVWLFSYPEGVPGVVAPLVVLPLLLLLWLAVVILWVLRIWRGTQRLRRWNRSAVSRMWFLTFILVAGIAVVLFGAALRVRFEASETSLKRLAENPPSRPARTQQDRRAGLYTVQEYWRQRNGVVMLVTNECGLVDVCGFAYAPREVPLEVCESYNVRRFRHLTGDWFTFRWSEVDSGCD